MFKGIFVQYFMEGDNDIFGIAAFKRGDKGKFRQNDMFFLHGVYFGYESADTAQAESGNIFSREIVCIREVIFIFAESFDEVVSDDSSVG